MKTRFLIIAALLLGIIGCKPKTSPQETASSTVYPYDLTVDVDKGTMNLVWKRSGQGLISGYKIFISETPLVSTYPDGNYPESAVPFNNADFPGDTNPDDGLEHFTAEGLRDGVKYYVSVRVTNPDRTLSRSSNEVIAVTGPRGEFNLMARYQGEQDGFSFDNESYVRADNTANDLYFFSAEGKHYLSSPTRLDGFLRKTTFMVLPYKGDFTTVGSEVMAASLEPSDERVQIRKGDWVLARTADAHHALLHVTGVSGSADNARVQLEYLVSTLQGEMFF